MEYPLIWPAACFRERPISIWGLELHIHRHAASQKKYAGKGEEAKVKEARITKLSYQGLIDNLQGTIKGLNWEGAGTEWGDYYDATNYTPAAFERKKSLVGEFIDQVNPKMIWDLGANNGEFSRIGSGKGFFTVSSDIDPVAVEKNYQECRKQKEKNLLPLLIDLTNPSPGIGWENDERTSFIERGPVDLVMALALIHHLAISNNLPLDRVGEFFAKAGEWLIIEFVPKDDSQVQRLLSSRKDIFPEYNEAGFESSFGARLQIDSQRINRGFEANPLFVSKKIRISESVSESPKRLHFFRPSFEPAAGALAENRYRETDMTSSLGTRVKAKISRHKENQ